MLTDADPTPFSLTGDDDKMTARKTLWAIKSWDDLIAWADRLRVNTGSRNAWCILGDCLRRDPVDCQPGPDEEYIRMASRLAVRNADPSYRGYTPWGDIHD